MRELEYTALHSSVHFLKCLHTLLVHNGKTNRIALSSKRVRANAHEHEALVADTKGSIEAKVHPPLSIDATHCILDKEWGRVAAIYNTVSVLISQAYRFVKFEMLASGIMLGNPIFQK